MISKRHTMSGFGLALAFALALSLPTTAGSGVGSEGDACSKYGSDSLKTLEKISLYAEFYKQKNYDDALVHWKYIFENAPGNSKNTFIRGAKMYSTKIKEAKKAENDSALQVYLDTLIMIYDKRMECFGQRAYVLGTKAYDLYKYRRNKEDYGIIRGYLGESLQEDPKNFKSPWAYSYFWFSRSLWKVDSISDDQLLDDFDLVMSTGRKQLTDLEAALAAATDEKKRRSYQAKLDGWNSMLPKMEQMLPRELLTCDKLIARIERDREEIFADVDKLKKAYNNIKLAPVDTAADGSVSRCTSDPIFGDIVLAIVDMEPNATVANEAGKWLAQRNDMEGAMEYFTKAMEMETDSMDNADNALYIAKILKNEKKYSEARRYARKALEYRPGWGEPYILIGDMYASSGNICGGMDGELCALAALDKYAVAKRDPESAETAQARLNKYSAYKPTVTYLFERGLAEGSAYTFGCWIGETTTLRAKKSN